MKSRITPRAITFCLLLIALVSYLAWSRMGPAPLTPDNLSSLDPPVAALIERGLSKVRWWPRDVQARIVLGKIYEANELHDLAAMTYRQALDQAPRDGKTWFRYAICLERQGDLDQAIQAMDRAIELEPSFAAARWRQAMWAVDVGDLEKATQRAEEAVQMDSTDSAAWFAKCRTHLARRENQAAIDLIEEKRLTSDPNGAYAKYLLGTAYRQLGDLQRAAPFLVNQDFRPVWRDDWSRELTAYHTGISRMRANASDLVRSGRMSEAVPMLQQILQQDPSDQRSLNMLGACYLQTKQFDQCQAVYQQSLKVNPDHFLTNLNFAAVLLQMHKLRPVDLNLALQHAERAIELRPQSAKAHQARAEAYHLMGRLDEAIQSLDRAYELNSDTPDLAVQAGMLEMESSDYTAAEARFQKLLTTNPDFASVYLGMANLKMTQGKFTEAQALLEQASSATHCTSQQRQVIEQRFQQLKPLIGS